MSFGVEKVESKIQVAESRSRVKTRSVRVKIELHFDSKRHTGKSKVRRASAFDSNSFDFACLLSVSVGAKNENGDTRGKC